VVIKADGLAFDIVDEFARERDPRTGKSLLPWIDHVFYQGGTRLANFYVRGTSLSGPSWSMLDTGQDLQIKGNVEFDRYTQHPYDYLNFIPFWLGNVTEHRGDMWGTTVVDELRLPLLLDAFGYDERYQSFQLFQRGSGWVTLARSMQNIDRRTETERPVRRMADRTGTRDMIPFQHEREIIEGSTTRRCAIWITTPPTSITTRITTATGRRTSPRCRSSMASSAPVDRDHCAARRPQRQPSCWLPITASTPIRDSSVRDSISCICSRLRKAARTT
jgi:hypothetical protein